MDGPPFCQGPTAGAGTAEDGDVRAVARAATGRSGQPAPGERTAGTGPL